MTIREIEHEEDTLWNSGGKSCLTVGTYSVKADDGGLKLVTGAIKPDGTSFFPTNTFTLAHPNTGEYIITFAPLVFGKTSPICVVTPVHNFTVGHLFVNVSVCDITLFDQNGNAADGIFAFMASRATGNINLS
ncbi:MAG TPA: hypothetical protein VKE72_07025 [Methylocella sp.]|nr:hypothetical protein [Methylocella sp.]